MEPHVDDADGITDDELTALALTADPDQPVERDAVPIALDGAAAGLLPEWFRAGLVQLIGPYPSASSATDGPASGAM